jgi:hypothetical protein
MGQGHYGVGILDVDYVVVKTETIGRVNGKQIQKKLWTCPYYIVWRNILTRCYSKAEHKRLPSYIGCTIEESWKKFSRFRKWMETQEWYGKQLDKDLLVEGNKHYGTDTCIFVDSIVNKFIADGSRQNVEYPLGVAYFKQTNKLQAGCRNPFTKKREHLGLFELNQVDLAHLAWKKRKHELSCIMADKQTCIRVSDALKKKYT